MTQNDFRYERTVKILRGLMRLDVLTNKEYWRARGQLLEFALSKTDTEPNNE